MCTTLSYDSYNKFIIPVFVSSLLLLPFCESYTTVRVLSILGNPAPRLLSDIIS